MPIRSALYIDGFNLYHAIRDLEEPFLKWCNLWELGRLIIPKQSEELVKVVFCTAYYPGNERKRWRHDQYLNALRVVGVECVRGHYVYEDWGCNSCDHKWSKPAEKASDINVALHLFIDGWEGVYDKAYLLTADSDQAATAKLFREKFPDKEIVSVAPPERNFSVHITKHINSKIALSREHIERVVFPSIVFKEGMPAGRRPTEYDPPRDWVPVDKRPR